MQKIHTHMTGIHVREYCLSVQCAFCQKSFSSWLPFFISSIRFSEAAKLLWCRQRDLNSYGFPAGFKPAAYSVPPYPQLMEPRIRVELIFSVRRTAVLSVVRTEHWSTRRESNPQTFVSKTKCYASSLLAGVMHPCCAWMLIQRGRTRTFISRFLPGSPTIGRHSDMVAATGFEPAFLWL